MVANGADFEGSDSPPAGSASSSSSAADSAEATAAGSAELPGQLQLASRSRWLIGGLIIVLVVAGAITWTVAAAKANRCGAGIELIPSPRTPLWDADAVAQRGDERLQTLAEQVAESAPPFGPLRAGLGFNYDQLLRLYPAGEAILALTRHNAPLTMLDGATLAPLWALRPARPRTAWEATASAFLLTQFAEEDRTQLVLFDADGHQQWCHKLGGSHAEADPYSTAFLADDGDIVVAHPTADGAIELTRLNRKDGEPRWQVEHDGLDRADFMVAVDDQLIVGGAEEHFLGQLDATVPAGSVLAGIDVADGTTRWFYEAPAGARTHIVGVTSDEIVVVQRVGGEATLIGLDHAGEQLWQQETPGGAFQAALRGGMVLLDAREALMAYDPATGKQAWVIELPAEDTFFPYGFTLAAVPSLSSEVVLLPTTDELWLLDVTTGEARTVELPTDGVSTTYWPYQLMVSPHFVAVITNIGGIVMDRVELGADPTE